MLAQILMIVGLTAASWLFGAVLFAFRPYDPFHRVNRLAAALISASAGILALSELLHLCR